MEYVKAYIRNFGLALYGGIRSDVPGHGGEECASYLPTNMKILDTGIAVLLMIPYFTYAIKTYTLPSSIKKKESNIVQRILLVVLCLVLGIQIGFKISAKSLLYILNPCYLMTAVEVSGHVLYDQTRCSMVITILTDIPPVNDSQQVLNRFVSNVDSSRVWSSSGNALPRNRTNCERMLLCDPLTSLIVFSEECRNSSLLSLLSVLSPAGHFRPSDRLLDPAHFDLLCYSSIHTIPLGYVVARIPHYIVL